LPIRTVKVKADMNNTAPLLLKETASNILRLTLNRPGTGNCLCLALLNELTKEILAAWNDPTIKVIIIAANGPLFCSGHDLKEMTARRSDDDDGRNFFERTFAASSAVMEAIIECPKPIIAQVQGPALAAGAQLIATCDLAIASDHACFSLPGVNIGLFCSTPMVAVGRNISLKHTMEMLLTGDMISAERGCEMGLVNRVVPPDDLTHETQALAQKIASKSSAVIKLGKHAFYKQAGMDLKSAYEYTTEVMIENMLNQAAEEGIGAFLEKRPPVWPELEAED
jgi:enoyl-CoA hydratase/carnithine racemase